MKINPKKCVEDIINISDQTKISLSMLNIVAESNGVDITYKKNIRCHAKYLYEDRMITVEGNLSTQETIFAIAYCLGRILFCDDVYEFCFDGDKNYDKIDSGKSAHGFGVEFANEFLMLLK